MEAANIIPYVTTLISMTFGILFAIVAWFAKRELSRNNKEIDKIKIEISELLKIQAKCPVEIRLWMQQNFVTNHSFERQERTVQENISKFKESLKQIDNNLSYLVKAKENE